ncbi:MAG: hypothetical protein AMXMBFR36_36100 [Acidobacteriota bacterium]
MIDRRHRRLAVALLCLATIAPGSAHGQASEEWRSWNQPVTPFKVFGALHYVGANDIAVYAFATPEGLIVLDGGFPETAPLVLASLAELGFRIEDVKILLNSHAHFDHAGGLAELAAKSGAKVFASARDADQLEAGGKGDFAWGDEGTFPPVAVDRRLADRETVTLGGVTLTAHVTAGHTRGCTTWTATLEDGGERREAVFVCSVSVPDPAAYRLADNPRYPEIADDYAASYERLRSFAPDLFFAAHGGFFDLDGKRARLAAGEKAVDVFTDRDGYGAYLDRNERRFRELLSEARAALAAKPPVSD